MDSLTRDDMKPWTEISPFEALSEAAQKALSRVARSRKVRGFNLSPEVLKELEEAGINGWLMVPARKGNRQIAFSQKAARAWVL